jgi:hypothetical protein
LKREADTPENRHLLIIAPSRSDSGQYLAEFGIDGISRQTSTPDSPHLDGEGAVNHLPRHIALGKMRAMTEAKAILSAESR